MDQQSTFWSEELPAKVSRSLDSGEGLKTREAGSCSRSSRSPSDTGQSGSSGKTSQVFCHQTEDGILVPSSGRWQSWGTGGPTESWTREGSEFPNDAVESSLSRVLEISGVPNRYFLSQNVRDNLLRRTQARGKTLPPLLVAALAAEAR